MTRPDDPGPPGNALRARLSALPESWKQLIRFALVGGLGTLTNLALFFAFVDVGGMDAFAGIVVCFAIAVTQNYAFNELWTFATQGAGALALARYLKFAGASIVGLGVNVLAYLALTSVFDFPLKVIPQAIGIAAGTAVNFLASRYLVFQPDDSAAR